MDVIEPGCNPEPEETLLQEMKKHGPWSLGVPSFPARYSAQFEFDGIEDVTLSEPCEGRLLGLKSFPWYALNGPITLSVDL